MIWLDNYEIINIANGSIPADDDKEVSATVRVRKP